MSIAAPLLALCSLLPLYQDDPPPDPIATVRGRLLLPSGVPAAGIRLKVSGWGANSDRILEFGHPRQWTDPEGVTDAEGHFELKFLPPRAFQFTLDAHPEGFGPLTWRWTEIALGETKDVGEVTLVAAGTVVGRILDARGEVLVKGWSVSAEPPRELVIGGRTSSYVYGELDPETGEFRIEGLPAGRVSIRARASSGESTDTVSCEVVGGAEVAVVLRYDGPDLARRITVSYSSAPFRMFRPTADAVTLVDEEGGARPAQEVVGSSSRVCFDDLPEGKYTVVISNPRFQPWSQADVTPGERVSASLRGVGKIALTVVDDRSGAVLTRYGLRVGFPDSGWSPNEFEVFPDGSARPAASLIEGLVPEPQELVVRAPGRPTLRVMIEAPTVDGALPIEVRVPLGVGLRALVLDAAGQPQQHVKVERTPGDRAGVAPGVSQTTSLGRTPNWESAYETDGEGRLSLHELSLGTHTFRVQASRYLSHDHTVELPVPEDAVLEWRPPSSGYLAGTVTAPGGADLTDWRLRLRGTGIPRMSLRDLPPEIAVDGSFHIGPLPVGTFEVTLTEPVDLGGGSSTWFQIELGTIEIEAGAVTRATFDLREHYPGQVEVVARVDGDEFGPLQVAFHFVDGAGASSRTLTADDRGVRTYAGLPPGEWRLDLGSPAGTWRWAAPGTVIVEPGQVTRVELEVELVSRVVTCLDSAGEPLSEAEVELWSGPRDRWPGRLSLVTDAQGRVSLRLPPGEVRACRPAPASEGRRRSLNGEPADSLPLLWLEDGTATVKLPDRK
ncbi:MAG: hypothetical protein O2816_02415 [Planctomycetota bacterium]|nr:hypothetical protein [Planctomycetota bacterium]